MTNTKSNCFLDYSEYVTSQHHAMCITTNTTNTTNNTNNNNNNKKKN